MRSLFIYYFVCTNLLIFSIFSGQSQVTGGLTFGGENNESGQSILQTNDGGMIIAATTRSYGSGCNDILIIKMNSYYQTVWSTVVGREYQDIARSIIEVNDGYIICGESWSNALESTGIYMLKIDKSGNIIFQKSYGQASLDNCFDVIGTSENNLLLVGYTRSIDIYGGVNLIMTNSEGDVIWDKVFGFQFDEYAMEAIEDNEGNFLIVGSKNGFFDDVHATFKTHDADIWVLKIDRDGNEIDNFIYGLDGHDFGYSIAPGINGYYLFGSTQSYGSGSFDMLLSYIDMEGNELWHTTYGGAEFDYGISMSKNQLNELYLLGTSKSFGHQGSTDIHLIKTNDIGDEQWSITIGNDYSDYGYQVVSTKDNGCAVIGSTQTGENEDTDIIFVKISSDGDIESFSELYEIMKENYILVPNPVISEAKVMLPDSNSSYKLEIYNTMGMTIGNYFVNSTNNIINMELLQSGTYVYALINLDNNSRLTGKISKK